MKTTAVVFPFDLFGTPGASAGAQLLGDELREILDDTRRETTPTRAAAFAPQVVIREIPLDTLDALADWRAAGRKAARQALKRGDFLVWLTGSHLGALPVYDELAGSQDLLVLQLDAHLDIHRFRDTTSELSHGNFLLHVEGELPPLVNAGHRDLLLLDSDIAQCYRAHFSAAKLLGGPPEELRAALGRADRVVLDIDCDVFDAAYFPGTGRPVPFGLSPEAVLRLLEAIPGDKLAGVLVSEFDPGRDRDDRSLALATWLLEYLLLRRYEKKMACRPGEPALS